MSNDSPPKDNDKWQCEKCTFRNWSSAHRCTMCRCIRPTTSSRFAASIQQSLNSNNVIATKSQDIYELAPPPLSSLSSDEAINTACNLSHGASSTENADRCDTDGASSVQKWACEACTFFNWPKSIKCTQCQSMRPKTIISSLQRHTGLNKSPTILTPLVLCNAPAQNSQVVLSCDGGTTKSPASPDVGEGTSADLGPAPLDTRLIAKKLQKWTCQGCTYENWPKATKCVMCYTPRRPGGGRSGSTIGFEKKSIGTPQSPASPSPAASVSPPGESNDKKRSASGSKDHGGKSPRNNRCSSNESVDVQESSKSILASNTSNMCVQVQPDESKFDKYLKKLRRQLKDVDYLWLNAIRSLFVDGLSDSDAIEAFVAAGGDVARALTPQEVHLFNSCFRGSRFEAGHTLIHLAVRYHREDLLSFLLVCSDQPSIAGGRRVKKVPCHVSPDAAADIRRQVAMSLRQRKGDMSCYFFTDLTTFCLPSSIYDLPPTIQERLFDELLDRPVQKELEEEYSIINWSVEVTERLNSRLFALWNRTAGDCLLDSVLQATWGVFDSENSLRQALSDSLSDAANVFYPRWRDFETYIADLLHFTIDEDQFARDWELILQMASKPGTALEQVHIFALAHIIRRPIIVYGVRVVKSFRGESIDYARFEGLYLPLMWEPSFCWRSPVCLGYTRGHFCALVPIEPDAFDYVSMTRGREFSNQPRFAFLPLQDVDGQMLPLHFLNNNERGHEQSLLRSWLDVHVTDGGLLCCRMRLHRLPPTIGQMIDDWLGYYRRLAHAQQAATAALAAVAAARSARKSSAATVVAATARLSSPVSGCELPGQQVISTTTNQSEHPITNTTSSIRKSGSPIPTSKAQGALNDSFPKPFSTTNDVENEKHGGDQEESFRKSSPSCNELETGHNFEERAEKGSIT